MMAGIYTKVVNSEYKIRQKQQKKFHIHRTNSSEKINTTDNYSGPDRELNPGPPRYEPKHPNKESYY